MWDKFHEIWSGFRKILGGFPEIWGGFLEIWGGFCRGGSSWGAYPLSGRRPPKKINNVHIGNVRFQPLVGAFTTAVIANSSDFHRAILWKTLEHLRHSEKAIPRLEDKTGCSRWLLYDSVQALKDVIVPLMICRKSPAGFLGSWRNLVRELIRYANLALFRVPCSCFYFSSETVELGAEPRSVPEPPSSNIYISEGFAIRDF